MQTFLPFADPVWSARVLDWKRLGKQRVEAYQILRALTGKTKSRGWQHHPAVIMWRGHEDALGIYMNAMIIEWQVRGYHNTMEFWSPGSLPIRWPGWWGATKFHASHRAALLRKDPRWYSANLALGWDQEPAEYCWPVTQSGVLVVRPRYVDALREETLIKNFAHWYRKYVEKFTPKPKPLSPAIVNRLRALAAERERWAWIAKGKPAWQRQRKSS